MPRIVARNYRALAERQNRAVWSDLGGLIADPMVRRALPDIEESAHKAEQLAILERRNRLASEIIRASESPRIFFNHRYFRHCSACTVVSTDEAVIELRRLIVKNRMKKGHRSYRPVIIPELQEAMVFARYFRRFSSRIWPQSRAAA